MGELSGVEFQDEWRELLAGEVAEAAGDQTLPLILSHREVGELTQVGNLGSLALRTIYAAALRPGELLRLRACDVRGGFVQVDTRRIPLDGLTAGALAQLGLERESLFEATPALLDGWLQSAARSCGVAERYRSCGRGLTAVCLRHACATHLLENGMDLFALHTFLGHQNLGCTRQYLQAAVGLRGAAYARCHPLMAGQRVLPDWKGEDLKAFLDGPAEEAPEPSVASPTIPEVRQILESARSLRDRFMLRAYYATGLRRNELLHCTLGDVVAEEGRIFCRAGKEDKDRYVLVDPVTLQWLAELAPVSALIGLKETRVGEIFRECADRCGLREHYRRQGQVLSLHSLRHAFATHLYLNGMPLASLKRLLGHDRLDTTAGYLRCSWEHCLEQYHEYRVG